MQPPQQDPAYHYQPPQQSGETYYSSSQSDAAPYPPLPSAYPPPQYSYPPQQQPGVYPPPGPAYPPQQSAYPYISPQQFASSAGSPRSNRAMYYGIFSLILSSITFFSQVGFAGVITGTIAIVYGFIGLIASNKVSNHAGRLQASIGIVLGVVAWGLVIASYMIRSHAYNGY